MSLPWFPFNIKDFAANTKRLNTEAKGAYLELMLDYYQTEEGPPDDDEVLATITGLSVEAWKRHRRVIAPLFEIKDGVWRHGRIEQEIVEASAKHAASIARAEAGAAARWGNKSPKDPPRMPKASAKHAASTKSASSKPQAMPQASPKQSLENAHTQTQIDDGGGDDARAREPISVSEIEDQLTGTQPVTIGVPIDHWQPAFVHPADLDLLNQFCAYHEERSTFSKDWPTLWQKFLDDAKAPTPEPAKPKKRTAPPRVETDKRPEQIPGVRVLISEEAYALANAVTDVMGVRGLPITVGMPAQMQTWLAAWPGDLILLAIQRVMARRPGDPPTTMKYFENAIAREVAESQRPLPVAKLAPPSQEIIVHGSTRRTESKSVSEAARGLAAEFAALTGGGTSDGDQ